MAPATPNFPVDLDPISSVRTHPQVRQIGERNFFTFLRASSRNLERNKNTILPLKKKKKESKNNDRQKWGYYSKKQLKLEKELWNIMFVIRGYDNWMEPWVCTKEFDLKEFKKEWKIQESA